MLSFGHWIEKKYESSLSDAKSCHSFIPFGILRISFWQALALRREGKIHCMIMESSFSNVSCVRKWGNYTMLSSSYACELFKDPQWVLETGALHRLYRFLSSSPRFPSLSIPFPFHPLLLLLLRRTPLLLSIKIELNYFVFHFMTLLPQPLSAEIKGILYYTRPSTSVYT